MNQFSTAIDPVTRAFRKGRDASSPFRSPRGENPLHEDDLQEDIRQPGRIHYLRAWRPSLGGGAAAEQLPDEWLDREPGDFERLSRSIIKPPVWKSPQPSGDAFHALQKWEGVVTERDDECFWARLTDLTSSGPTEEVELLIQDVPWEDRSLVEPGAVFYWSIGYRDEASGQRWRASTLRFRRLPVWSEDELEIARVRAGDVKKVFGGD